MNNSNKWCTTVDGKEINLFDPDPSIFTVDRIANALARINRFAGAWVRPISVARHSMRVAERLRSGGCDIETQLQGLFHDAAEAFTTDIPSPLKRLLYVAAPSLGEEHVTFHRFENFLVHRIFDRLRIEWPLRPEVHETDTQLTEGEKGWVFGKKCNLYRGLSTNPDVIAVAFKYKANALFAERAHANNIPTGAGK